MIILKILLFPFSMIYGTIIFFRNMFYDIGIFTVHKASVPVISVGNLTAGGTGKTPIVEFLAKYILNKNKKKVAVISRGYKRKSSGTVTVSDGSKIIVTPEESGDEPYQIARKLNNAIVIVDENRYRAAILAVEKYKCDVIVLDDGFQHRKIHRDLNLVVIDDAKNPQKEFMIPAGYRREPISALKRADYIIFSRSDRNISFGNNYDNIPFAVARFDIKKILNLNNGEPIDVEKIVGKTCMAFCGIGNPKSFEKSLNDLGLKIIKFRRFPDHYNYNEDNVNMIINDFKTLKTDYIITTEKDSVRLLKFKNKFKDIPLYYAELDVNMTSGIDDPLNQINKLINNR